MQEEITEMKTDIALIKKDVQNIQRFFAKVETSLDMMTDLSKKVAVQDEVLKNTIDKLEDLDTMVQDHRVEDQERSQRMMDRLEEYRSAAYNDHQRLADHTATKREKHNQLLIDEIRAMREMMEEKLDEQDEKIEDLNRWKYYAMGALGLAMFVMVEMNWQVVFG
jgi:DNA anti-recombination protein RmuC